MARVFKLHRRPRLAMAGIVGMAGVLVSATMVLRGGEMAEHLPEQGFHAAAFIGAFLAGLLLADGFGHSGVKGAFWSVGWFVLATLVGAGLGGSLGMMMVMPFADTGLGAASVAQVVEGLPTLAFFGWIAILDAVLTSVAVVVTWAVALVGVQTMAVMVRDRFQVIVGAEAF